MAGSPPLSLRLPAKRHLRTPGEFTRLKRMGRRMVKGCLAANWMPLPPGTSSRVGVIATRKLGSAVVRNRARRLLREVFRLHQCELRKPVELVLVARHSIREKGLAEVTRDYLAFLREAGLWEPRLPQNASRPCSEQPRE